MVQGTGISYFAIEQEKIFELVAILLETNRNLRFYKKPGTLFLADIIKKEKEYA